MALKIVKLINRIPDDKYVFDEIVIPETELKYMPKSISYQTDKDIVDYKKRLPKSDLDQVIKGALYLYIVSETMSINDMKNELKTMALVTHLDKISKLKELISYEERELSMIDSIIF